MWRRHVAFFLTFYSYDDDPCHLLCYVPLPSPRPCTGLNGNKLRDIVKEAIRSLPNLPDWLDEDFRAKKGWPSFKQALEVVHNPGIYLYRLLVVPPPRNDAMHPSHSVDHSSFSILPIYVCIQKRLRRISIQDVKPGSV